MRHSSNLWFPLLVLLLFWFSIVPFAVREHHEMIRKMSSLQSLNVAIYVYTYICISLLLYCLSLSCFPRRPRPSAACREEEIVQPLKNSTGQVTRLHPRTKVAREQKVSSQHPFLRFPFKIFHCYICDFLLFALWFSIVPFQQLNR